MTHLFSRTLIVCVALLVVVTAASPCIQWVQVCGPDPVPDTILVVGNQQSRWDVVRNWQELACIPDSNTSTFGHRDYPDNDPPWSRYCWYSVTGQEPAPSGGNTPPHSISCNKVAVASNDTMHKLTWTLANAGTSVPYNAILSDDGFSALGRSLASSTNYGNVMTGYIPVTGGKLTSLYFDDYGGNAVGDFEVATCTGLTPPPTTTPQPTHHAPTEPFIRFGHTVPSEEAVDCVITQGTVSYTWTKYQFGHFSDWVQEFKTGNGTIELYHNVNGQRGEKLLTVTRFLTPGPLVVVIKDYWPPRYDWNVETIAASYVPVAEGHSAVRFFNLSPDTKAGGLQVGSTTLANGIPYSLGSNWVPVQTSVSMTLTAISSNSGGSLGNVTMTAPSGSVFTAFLIGVQNATFLPGVRTQLLALIDAPE